MAKKRSVKIILDTNWYISACINRKSRRTLYEILTNPAFQIFYSKELIQEFQEVIKRPKFRKFISETHVLRFQSLALSKLKETKITSSIELSRDPNDNYLLAMAIDANADFLVTGDDDLLVVKKIGNTLIVKMSEFHALNHQKLNQL